MKLNEVFQNSYPWKWTIKDRSDEYIAKFTPDDGYIVTADFQYEEDERWGFEFYRESGTTYRNISDEPVKAVTSKITGQGDAFQIFATLKEIFADFVNIEDPYEIEFSAKEPSRRKLYSKFLPKLSRELGMWFDMHVEEPDRYDRNPDKVFVLTKAK